MPNYLLSNNAISTLAAPITTGATTLTVNSGDGAKFPSGATANMPFPLVVRAATYPVPASYEIMLCTGRNSDTLTVVRAQEGTSAFPFNAGDVVGLDLTAGVVQSLTTSISSVANLRLVSGQTSGQIVTLAGYSTQGDGGGGPFYWGAYATDNGGTIITPTGQAAGSWYRVDGFNGRVKAGWFGIFPNGTNYSSQMQSLMNYINSTFGSGTIFLQVTNATPYTMAFNHVSGVMIESESWQSQFSDNGTYVIGSTIQVPSAGGNIISQNSATYGGGVRGIRFKGLGSSVSSSAIVLGTSYICKDYTMQNIEAESFADGAFLFGTNTSYLIVDGVLADNCILNRTRSATTYVFDYQGGDGTILQNIEVTPSLSALSSSNKYVRAIHLGSSTSNNIRCDNLLGEYADVGITIEGTLHHIGKLRGEFSFAENFLIYCTSSSIEMLRSGEASLSTTNTYDGIYYDSTSSNNVIAQENDVNNNSGFASRYSVNDQFTGDNNKNTHLCVTGKGFGTALINPPVFAGSKFIVSDGPFQTLTANSATPRLDINGRLDRNWQTANTSATLITAFLGSASGGIYTINCTDSNTTLQHNGAAPGFILPDAKNLVLVSGEMYTFISDGGTFHLIDSKYWNSAPAASNPSIVSGTVYQNNTAGFITIYVPITYSPTSGAAATCAVALGSISTPSVIYTNSKPAGITALDGDVEIQSLYVPPNWYYSFTVTNATIGTVTQITGA